MKESNCDAAERIYAEKLAGSNAGAVSTLAMAPAEEPSEPLFGHSKRALADQLRQARKRIGWLEQDLERAFQRVNSQQKQITAHYQEFTWLREVVELHLREQHKSVIVNVPEQVTVVPDHLEIQPLADAVNATVDKLNRAGKK